MTFCKVAAKNNVLILADTQKLMNHKYIGGVPIFLRIVNIVKVVNNLEFTIKLLVIYKNIISEEKKAWIKKYFTMEIRSLIENCHNKNLSKFISIKIQTDIKDFIMIAVSKDALIKIFLKKFKYWFIN